jgi:hypothetical protein
MNNLHCDAICLWGNPHTYIEDQCTELSAVYSCRRDVIFVHTSDSIWHSLWRANALKRKSEMQSGQLYRRVLYVHTDSVVEACRNAIHMPRSSAPHTLYYYHGVYDNHIRGTGIHPTILYCDSLSGDLVANYQYTRTHREIPYDFYYHCKSYKLRTAPISAHSFIRKDA